MSDLNAKTLYDALRKVGVVIPELPTLSTNVVPIVERKYWHVSCGPFDTMVDFRDAASPDVALDAAVDPLQPWYVRRSQDELLAKFEYAPNVEEASRDQYLDWLRRGVK